MRDKKQLTDKSIINMALIGSFLIIALIAANSLWASRVTASATDEAVTAVSAFYLETMADRRAETVINQIDSDFEQMGKAVAFIDDEDIQSQEELRATLGKIEKLLSLERFALVDEDDVVYTQYTTYMGGSRYEFLSQENMDDHLVSTLSLYDSSKQLCLAMPTPDLSLAGKDFKACFIQIDLNELIKLVEPDDSGRTYLAVYSKNGENLSGTELGPSISNQNIIDATESLVAQETWQKVSDNFAQGIKGSLAFSSSGVEETLIYVPIPGPEWMLVVSIRDSVITQQISGISERNLAISRYEIVFALMVMVLFATILFLKLRSLSKMELDAEKETSRAFENMANTDSMTGVRNKHAYYDAVKVLNRQIREGQLEKLAVVVCDINGLKFVNDTQGHAAGDQLIKDACQMICDFFSHGAVFRIGGDEFVVLLRDKGYDSTEEIVEQFNRHAEASIGTQSAVVALGHSVLSERDREVSDVFRRADKIMYERKKELKAMGAHGRDL